MADILCRWSAYWVGRFRRAGCISQDTYLLYEIMWNYEVLIKVYIWNTIEMIPPIFATVATITLPGTHINISQALDDMIISAFCELSLNEIKVAALHSFTPFFLQDFWLHDCKQFIYDPTVLREIYLLLLLWSKPVHGCGLKILMLHCLGHPLYQFS